MVGHAKLSSHVQLGRVKITACRWSRFAFCGKLCGGPNNMLKALISKGVRQAGSAPGARLSDWPYRMHGAPLKGEQGVAAFNGVRASCASVWSSHAAQLLGDLIKRKGLQNATMDVQYAALCQHPAIQLCAY